MRARAKSRFSWQCGRSWLCHVLGNSVAIFNVGWFEWNGVYWRSVNGKLHWSNSMDNGNDCLQSRFMHKRAAASNPFFYLLSRGTMLLCDFHYINTLFESRCRNIESVCCTYLSPYLSLFPFFHTSTQYFTLALTLSSTKTIWYIQWSQWIAIRCTGLTRDLLLRRLINLLKNVLTNSVKPFNSLTVTVMGISRPRN